MRGFRILLVASLVAIAIGVGVEAISDANGDVATLHSAVTSLGTSPYLQARLNVSTDGIDAPPALAALSVTVAAASTDGHTPLNASTTDSTNAQFTLAYQRTDLVDIRVVADKTTYVRVYFGAIELVPGVPASSDVALSVLGALLDGKWFSVPSDLGKNLLPASGLPSNIGLPTTKTITPAQREAVTNAAKKLEDDLLAVTKVTSTPVSRGTVITATADLAALATVVVNDLGPLVGQFTNLPSDKINSAIANARSSAANATGTVVVHAITDGSGVMTSGSLGISQPHQRATIVASIRHDPIDLGVPSGAQSLPAAFIRALEAQLHLPAIA